MGRTYHWIIIRPVPGFPGDELVATAISCVDRDTMMCCVKKYLSTLTAFQRVILEYGTGQHGHGAKPLLFGQAQTLANEMVDYAGPPIWIGDNTSRIQHPNKINQYRI